MAAVEYVLDMTLTCARNLRAVNHYYIRKMEAYAVVRLGQFQFRSHVDPKNGANPQWDERFCFIFPSISSSSSSSSSSLSSSSQSSSSSSLPSPSSLLQSPRAVDESSMVRIDIYTLSILGPKIVGEVSIPLSDIAAATLRSNKPQHRRLPVNTASGSFQGELHVSYALRRRDVVALAKSSCDQLDEPAEPLDSGFSTHKNPRQMSSPLRLQTPSDGSRDTVNAALAPDHPPPPVTRGSSQRTIFASPVGRILLTNLSKGSSANKI